MVAEIGVPGGNYLDHCLVQLHLFEFLHLLFPYWHLLIFGQVSLGVFREVIATHELAGADWTLVLLLPSMRASVSGELIGASKPSLTVFPVAQVRFFTRVGPHMGFEMGTLIVGLTAPRVLACEWFWPVFFFHLLVQRPYLVGLCQDRYHRHQILLDKLGDDCLVGLGEYNYLSWWEVTFAQYAAPIATAVHGPDKGSE